VVCYTENKNFVGTLAKNKMYQFPESTIFENKSLIGKSFKEYEKDIKEDMSKRCHVKIFEDKITKKSKYEVNIKGNRKQYFPEEVSSEILKEIKKKFQKNIIKILKKQ
jgi:molecular chaperone DnaK (HSP70)